MLLNSEISLIKKWNYFERAQGPFSWSVVLGPVWGRKLERIRFEPHSDHSICIIMFRLMRYESPPKFCELFPRTGHGLFETDRIGKKWGFKRNQTYKIKVQYCKIIN